MEAITTIPTVAHVIQQALTPVFLLGGIGSILNVLTGRLARTVDRYRVLNDKSITDSPEYAFEMSLIPRRVRLIQWAISLSSVSALLICASIVTLFLGAELGLTLSRVVSILFILAITALTASLLCFFREITLATGNIISS
ncbi:DUF2721 domain-containing protein [Methylomonas sp. AM2-LC]|uniref:DUF2721 domain-containing protein n=1 Tax=Methylomonas sp. AM2-LC TaxID=3153301 RepID=UPI003263DB5C